MMTMVQAAAKDSKARIVNEFQQILAERQTLASRVVTREEEAEKEQNRSVLESVAQYTADGIIRGLADLQLEFGTIITGLSTQLTTETAKLDDLKRAIAAESQNLQDLRQTRVVADALYLLTQEHQANLRLLEQRLTSERESLEKEITEMRKLWQREQAEFDLSVNDSNELLQWERQRQEADYQYDNERSRKIATDDYEETQRQSERELQ
ncbi:MAG TPA: hypothetical protein V6C98_07555, partial [Thermosynechococcaceae cyanobacterium]